MPDMNPTEPTEAELELEETREDLRDRLHDGIERWDEFIDERWAMTEVSDCSPDSNPVSDRRGRSEFYSLPEAPEVLKAMREFSNVMEEHLRLVGEAERQAKNAYYVARAKLAEALKAQGYSVPKRDH